MNEERIISVTNEPKIEMIGYGVDMQKESFAYQIHLLKTKYDGYHLTSLVLKTKIERKSECDELKDLLRVHYHCFSVDKVVRTKSDYKEGEFKVNLIGLAADAVYQKQGYNVEPFIHTFIGMALSRLMISVVLESKDDVKRMIDFMEYTTNCFLK